MLCLSTQLKGNTTSTSLMKHQLTCTIFSTIIKLIIGPEQVIQYTSTTYQSDISTGEGGEGGGQQKQKTLQKYTIQQRMHNIREQIKRGGDGRKK